MDRESDVAESLGHVLHALSPSTLKILSWVLLYLVSEESEVERLNDLPKVMKLIKEGEGTQTHVICLYCSFIKLLTTKVVQMRGYELS